ncbi:PfkB family carbohydrate kinase [Microbacterium sp. Marseille-Q6648]|uniref:PfkB family carbohydrate kinase n=1 Tax=Microbacterium sp. Marseille-Q6648 TaxID=2937991 RepID=UPI00203C7312|nr:PfkB family carbohydrate kinase [Microbacterium sp. Marseille-Q6648]
MTGPVVVIGDALIDELRDDSGVREFVGGAALNVAVGLSRLGVSTALIAMVGDDEAGDHIRSFLADFGVRLIPTASPLGTARAVSTRSGGGEPEYVFNEASQRRRIRYGDAERAAIAEAPLVAISCIALDDLAQTRELGEVLSATGVRFAIDPNPRTGMLSDRAEFVRGFEGLAASATLVKVGEDDATLLYGEPLDTLRARLIDLGAGAVLATYGSAGAAIEAGGAVVNRPISALPGRIVDTMGAGDAAFAATLAALLDRSPGNQDEWGDVLQYAMDVAAATCRFEGALLRLPRALEDDDIDRIGT